MSPNAAEDFLHDWAAIGVPVIVHPGNGNSVADKLNRSIVDAREPLTRPKGA